MNTIILIGLSLFLCSTVAIYITLSASSLNDLQRKPLSKSKWPWLRRAKKKSARTTDDALALANRRNLDDNGRSLEGAVFFF